MNDKEINTNSQELASEHLTDRTFWKNFWESKKDLIFSIKEDYYFGNIMAGLIAQKGIKTAIELGGFPGYYATYLKKYQKLDTTLFDYYVDEEIINRLLVKNGLSAGDIHIIESDLFKYNSPQQYDLVTSFGLIEHFSDTRDIIQRHLQFLKPGGVLFITLPNFKGVNGWVQRTFDRENYDKHFIESMNPTLLASYCRQMGLKEVEAYYHGKFSVWLENKATKGAVAKALVKGIWLAGKVFTKIVPVETKVLSPYIVLKAIK